LRPMAEGGSPFLASATHLERWADLRSAQADLPRLVRRLIRQENDQVQPLEMRAGEGVGLPGYDGTVESTRGTPFVPDGLSVWEMGTGDPPADKANEDYKSRTANPLGVDPATTTFVFVTPRRWSKKKDWEQKRREEGPWRDVRVLDADDLELALEEAPAVRVWLSELLDLTPLGVETIEKWWRAFANSFEPALARDVVLAGRDDEAASLLRRLAQETGRTFVRAASIDDGLAFVACAMTAAEGDQQAGPLLSRSLLVHDGVALRRLEYSARLLILLPYEEKLQREARLVENHHVVFIVTDGDADIVLPALDHLALDAALRAAGVPEAELARYVRAGNKSLVALQRVASRLGQPDPDAWSQDLDDRAVRRAWLAGSWSQQRTGDTEVLAALTGKSGEDLDERLSRAARQPDPLFTRVGSVWAVAAPEDSWRAARFAIRDADLDALERAVQTVLGAVDPRLDLAPEDRWNAVIHGKVPIHSEDLRQGLARSLALLGARGDDVRLAGGRTARQWSERVVWRLFRRANEAESVHLWASIEGVLPLLAEAAPDVFLRAVAEGTAGKEPLLRDMFQDRTDDWNVSSPHTGLLWALECVAWSPVHLGFAAELLARLAELDPGGRLSNRPATSLNDVFRPWMPQTSASAQTRVATLNALSGRHSDVVWQVLLNSLPELRSVGLENAKPRFRDWAREADREITYAEYDEVVDALAGRVVGLATEQPARWAAVVERFDRLPSTAREAVVQALDGLDPDRLDDHLVTTLWAKTGALVRRHREYPDAEWSLPEQWLSRLVAAADRWKPRRPSEAHRWLFEDWHPEIGVAASEDLQAYDAEVNRRRRAAITEVLASEGFEAVQTLAEAVELPWAVGAALAEASSDHDLDTLSLLDADGRLLQFATGFARARTAGDVEHVRAWVAAFAGRPQIQARLLLLVDDVQLAWRAVAELGGGVEALYWREFLPYGRGADFAHVDDAARHLLTHGRAAAAVDALSMYAERATVGVDVVIDALRQFGGRDDPEAGRVSAYDLRRLLDYLLSRGVDDTEVARFEWKFLPVLRHEARGLALARVLARDPGFFVEVVTLAFKPAQRDGPGKRDAVDPAVAANAYSLLRDWRIVPGSADDGTVDGVALRDWVARARQLLSDADRLDIGELQFGEVLAHAPADADGTFPALAVRDVLETAQGDRLERGFALGLLNKRGVTSRSMTEGGKQEYDLADRYERWADAVQATHPRTAGVLRGVAETYREEGRRNDEEAKRFLEGLDR